MGSGRLRDINNHDVKGQELYSTYLAYQLIEDEEYITTTYSSNEISNALGLTSSSLALTGILLNFGVYLLM